MNSLVKFRVKGLPVVILHDKTMWREPFIIETKRGKKRYGFKQIFPHYFKGNIYYRINNNRYSSLQIDDWSYRVVEEVNIPQRNSDAPFFSRGI
jgi:hypothetical protein